MPRQQQVSTVVVPEPVSGVTAAPSKGKREPNPLVMVPESIVIEDEPEPHWLPAIDAATD